MQIGATFGVVAMFASLAQAAGRSPEPQGFSATAVTGSPNTPLLFDLRCERLPEPLGVVEPRFSWKYANAVAPCFAFAVSSSPDAASAGDIFRCETQSHYLFDPKLALKPLTRYWWEVACGGATNQATFVTGACHPPETFFGFPTDDGGYWWAQRLVSVRKVRSAILAVTVRGSYRLFVNGHVLDDGIAPNRSRIETGFLLTETYDVTPFVTDGDNRIELLLDDGWGRVCGKRACFSVCGKFVTDAGEVLLGEDGPWRVAASEMHATGKGPPQDYFAGEYLKDLSRRTDALDWSPARPVTGEVFRVENDIAERDGEIGRLHPVSIGTKAPWKIDFGRNFCGFIRLRLKGRPGGLATVTVADKDGEECSFNQLWKFELDAEEGAFESRLNWMSGRYLYLSGAARPDVADVEGVALSSIRRQTGGFSGDRDLEDVAALDAATYRACTLRGVTMDCPHRERLGYGEAGISTTWGVGLPYFDTAAFYTAYLHKWASSQREDGYVPHVTPDYHGGGGTTWGNYPVVALADMLRKYPDPRLRDRMKRTVVGWLEFLRQQMKDGLLTRYETDEWGFLGDWATPEGDDWGKSREAIYFNNAAYAYAIVRALEIDGLFTSEERNLWIRHHRQLCSAIDRAFYADGVYVSTNARYQAVGLLCGAADGHRAETERMMLDIVRRKGYVDGGSAGFTMVLRALCGSYEGRELALRALRRRECPGYLYFRDQGDTTLPELWDRRDQYGGSRIHTCYTGASGFLLRGLAGFDIRGDRVSVTPHLSESLPRYSVFEETVNGRLSLNVERQGEKIRVSVDLPWGCEGTLNACGVHELHAGRNEQLLPMEQVCREPKDDDDQKIQSTAPN